MLTSADERLSVPEFEYRVGIIVDSGPSLGYGHVVRCLRLANALSNMAAVAFYPMSENCLEFLLSCGVDDEFEIRDCRLDLHSLPSVMVSDLREAHPITAAMQNLGVRHISIRDLGLAQSPSDVVIDGAITRIFPYLPDNNRSFYLGPQYMITRQPVQRAATTDTVLVTFGGGSTCRFANQICENIYKMGLTPIATRGFIGSEPMSDQEFNAALSGCRFAISGSGVSLYDLLASGVPTIAVAFDRLQLRTANAFQEHGAVINAGLMECLTGDALITYCVDMIEQEDLVKRMTEAGQELVDGKGLSRITEIVRRELWQTSRMETYTAC